MNHVRIKICGITRAEDALAAVALGADAIGLVFYEASHRVVNAAKAREIVHLLPPFISKVGLFVDANESYIRKVMAEVSLDVLQFHGDESVEDCRRYEKPYIKAIKMREAMDFHQQIAEYPDASGILIDTYVEGEAGGTGEVFDWGLIPQDITGKAIILAGGLSPYNVADAILKTKPYAVDVSSGVEQDKGIKSKEKMQAFIREVKYARG